MSAAAVVLIIATAAGSLCAQVDWRDETRDTQVAVRWGVAAAYDMSRRCVVAFGGGNSIGLLARTETWDGSHWTRPNLAVEPSPRDGHAMAFDVARGRTLLFGGRGANQATLGDTWEWDGTAWQQRFFAGPTARNYHAMACDIVRGRVVLFGGWGSSGISFNDTWEWDGSSWTQRQPLHSPVHVPASQLMAYDILRGRCVMCLVPLSFLPPLLPMEVWEWDGNDWFLMNQPNIPAMNAAAIAYDLAAARTMLWGQLQVSPGASINALLAWNGVQWMNLTPVYAALPPQRYGGALAYDIARSRLVMFSGEGAGSYSLTDTWEWDGSTWDSPQPTPRTGHAVAFDIARGTGVMFGGRVNGLGAGNDPIQETWVWRAGGWHAAFPPRTLLMRSWASMAFDATRQRTVLFGGQSTPQYGYRSDTWEWDGVTWSQRLVSASPPARGEAAMAFDSARQLVVLFGGRSTPSTVLQDTWIYDGTSWAPQTPAHSPPARGGSAFAFDDARQRGVLFGGYNGSNGTGGTADTWEWDGSDWIARAPTTTPPARSQATLVFDRSRNRCVLTGGGLAASLPLLDDSWEWDGTDWQQRTPLVRSTPRAQAAAFFDPIANRTILFGGHTATNALLADTWSYGPVNAATLAAFGSGCAGSAGMPALHALSGSLPWLGDPLTLAVEPTPANASVLLALGFSRTMSGSTALPAALDAIGMTGCTLFVSIDDTRLALANGTRADFALAVPTTTTLVGLQFFAQAAVADTLANPAGIVASNALEGRLGAR